MRLSKQSRIIDLTLNTVFYEKFKTICVLVVVSFPKVDGVGVKIDKVGKRRRVTGPLGQALCLSHRQRRLCHHQHRHCHRHRHRLRRINIIICDRPAWTVFLPSSSALPSSWSSSTTSQYCHHHRHGHRQHHHQQQAHCQHCASYD